MTPAVRLLQAHGIVHALHTYACDDDGDWGMSAARALELDPAQVFKTLLLTLDDRRPMVALIPVNTRLDLKAAAAAGNGRRAGMTPPADAERLTGYVVGGISPLGQRKVLPTLVDASAETLPRIFVSAGRRGLQLELATTDLLRLLQARLVPIARSRHTK